VANLSAFGGAQPITPGGEVEVGYVAQANHYTSTATTPGAAANIFSTDLTIVADGVTPYTIEFYSPEYHVGPNAPAFSYLYLYQDGSLLYQSNAAAYADGTYNAFNNAYQKWRIVPTAGTHTYNVRATASLGTVNVNGSVTNYPPNYMRACKVVQQNDGLKPFWTPPIVTQLPSNATVGDQVIYAADATNGVYWSLYYDGGGTYPWKFVGGAPLNDTGSTANTSSTSYVDAGEASVIAPLAGDYYAEFNGHAGIAATEHAYITLYFNGTNNGDANGGLIYGSSSNNDGVMSRRYAINVTTANTVVKTQVRMSVPNSRTFSRQDLALVPIRVKAA